jgi:hypothetical protein
MASSSIVNPNTGVGNPFAVPFLKAMRGQMTGAPLSKLGGLKTITFTQPIFTELLCTRGSCVDLKKAARTGSWS